MGVEALRRLFARLPVELSATVSMVLPTANHGPEPLARVLGNSSCLPVSMGVEGERFTRGIIYVSPRPRRIATRCPRCRTNAPGAHLHRLSEKRPWDDGYRRLVAASVRGIPERSRGEAGGRVESGIGPDAFIMDRPPRR
jgi:chemotaxis response regulator CheB